jgi:hypothetical protein
VRDELQSPCHELWSTRRAWPRTEFGEDLGAPFLQLLDGGEVAGGVLEFEEGIPQLGRALLGHLSASNHPLEHRTHVYAQHGMYIRSVSMRGKAGDGGGGEVECRDEVSGRTVIFVELDEEAKVVENVGGLADKLLETSIEHISRIVHVSVRVILHHRCSTRERLMHSLFDQATPKRRAQLDAGVPVAT